MKQSSTENFRDRLSMIKADGSRLPLFPAEVRGFWRNRRTLVHTILIFIFMLAPWMTINGKSLFLLDIPGRHFVLLGMEFWAHDTPLLFLILGLATIGLAIATTLYGRIWCGWACPQTVFLDGVIRRIELWTEGTHLQRRALALAPWSLKKVFIKSTKWFLFFAFCFLLTHSLLAYFVGPDGVMKMITLAPTENKTAFFLISGITILLFFDLAWFREQFCLIVCPYGRIQAVLLDDHTINVQYDKTRGEPRKGQTIAGEKVGDCVSCNRCVLVCPTGIDIRNGLQMECIGCTACIDACDEIMEKVNKPKGLIRYMADVTKPQLLRPRVYAYLVLFSLLLGALVFSVAQRATVEISVLRAIDNPYFEVGDGAIANSYRLHVHNQSTESLDLSISLHSEAATLQLPDKSILNIKKNEFKMIPFLITVPSDKLSELTSPLQMTINQKNYEVHFVKPNN